MFEAFMRIRLFQNFTILTFYFSILAQKLRVILNIFLSYPESAFIRTRHLNHLASAEMRKSFLIRSLNFTFVIIWTFKNNLFDALLYFDVYLLIEIYFLLIVTSLRTLKIELADTLTAKKLKTLWAFKRIIHD